MFVAASPALAQTDPASVLQQLAGAFNRNDQTAAIAAFTDDAIVIGGPCGEESGGTCFGKAQLEQAIRGSEPVQVTISDVQVVGEGNTATFRTEERFSFPPQAVAAGVHRFVELGTVVVSGGKVARLGLVADVADAQTTTLFRVFSTLGPPPAAQSGPVASDGQSLGTQPASVAQQFASIWGSEAPARWVQEHEAALRGSGR